MSPESPNDSPAIRFFDSFLQERNIKWVLAAGMIILLGSSLMIVMPHWSTFAPLAKFITILAYSNLTFGIGWLSYHKLLLRKTGIGLLGLSVLLIPLTCAAWPWAWRGAESPAHTALAWLLLAVEGAIAGAVSRATFKHFLQADQWTFVLSYWALSLAGAIAPVLNLSHPLAAAGAAFALWGVFTVGAVKVNRHVFWLTEDRRQPRVYGFFPILLLGAQFLVITGVYCARQLTIDWIGLGCVLVAIPTLLTADAIAEVFQQRTGNLVRPLPKSILLPILVSLILCAAGLVLAAIPLAQRLPLALVPTAALISVVLAVVARRTSHQGFVWGMLLAGTVAYNFSPIFFQGMAKAALTQGAAAVQESRLPIAFYGLTYLPLILGIAGTSIVLTRRGDRLFSGPMRTYSLALCYLALALSCSHAKATFLVAAAMTVVLSVLTRAYRIREVATGAVIAYLLGSAALAPFLRAFGQDQLPDAWYLLFPCIASAALLAVAPWLDGRLRKLPWEIVSSGSDRQMGAASAVMSVLIALAWVGWIWVSPARSSLTVGLIVALLLAVHSLVWVRPGLSWFVYAFSVHSFLQCSSRQGFGIVDPLVTLLLVQWGTTSLLQRLPGNRVTAAWGSVLAYSSLGGLGLLTLVVGLPGLFRQSLHEPAAAIDWVRSALLVVWCWAAARRLWAGKMTFFSDSEAAKSVSQSLTLTQVLVIGGSLGALGLASAAMTGIWGEQVIVWHPLAWVVVSAVGLTVVYRLQRAETKQLTGSAQIASPPVRWKNEIEDANRVVSDEPVLAAIVPNSICCLRAIAAPVTALAMAVLVLVTMYQFYFFPLPARLAGAVGLVTLYIWTTAQRQSSRRLEVLVAANWWLLELAWQAFAPNATQLPQLLFGGNTTIGFAMLSLGASVSTWAWETFRARPATNQQLSDRERDFLVANGVVLRLAAVLGLLFVLPQGTQSWEVLGMGLASCVTLAASELWMAVRSAKQGRVWSALAITGAGVVWYKIANEVSPPMEVEMFLVLGAAVALHFGAWLAKRHAATHILLEPLLRTASSLPLVTVAMGVGYHLSASGPVAWRGVGSLAILFSGGYYFWQAIERRDSRFAVTAAVILNVALALLARELNLRDPQFYLVPVGISILALAETLRREIPESWRDPMRYAGALTILVSPTFHILQGSWLHLFTLLVGSTLVLLVAIGLRVRALLYTGTAFLIADLIAMVVCGGLDHPTVLWIAGVGLGASIIALGAFCELHRERLLQRLRLVSTQLRQWD